MFGIDLKNLNFGNLRKIFYFVPRLPRQVNIEPTTRCNLDCNVCKRKSLKLKDEDLSFDVFKKIISRLEGVKEISFGGFGEPLMNPKIFDMVRYAKEKGFILTTTTNGYLINPKNFDKVLVFDNLRISIESINSSKDSVQDGHPFSESLLDNIKELIKYRNKNNVKCKIFFNTIIHEGNYDSIADVVRYAQKIGVDCVELIHLDTKDNNAYKFVPKKKEISLYKKIKKRDFGIEVTSRYDRYIGLRKIGFRFNTKCPMSFDLLHIRMNGNVTPCAFGLPVYSLDNIFEKSLYNVWNGRKFKNFRKNQKKVCDGCTLYKWN